MTTDDKIDKILDELSDGEAHNIYSVCSRVLKEPHGEYYILHDVLIDKMHSKQLIKRPYHESQNTYCITGYGLEIVTNGGWLKHIYSKMTKGEKIHHVLKYMVENKDHGWQWSSVDLMPAFESRLDFREIEYLCRELVKNGHAAPLESKEGFAIGLIPESESAFWGQEYLNLSPLKMPINNQTSIHIGNNQNISGSSINGDVTGSIHYGKSIKDSGSKSPLMKFLIKHAKKIVIGVIVGLIIAFLTYIIKWK